MATEFIRIHNKVVALDSIGYIDFLDSGRSMVFVPGLSPEKQMITVDETETRRLRDFFDARMMAAGKPTGISAHSGPAIEERRVPDFSRRG